MPYNKEIIVVCKNAKCPRYNQKFSNLIIFGNHNPQSHCHVCNSILTIKDKEVKKRHEKLYPVY